MLHLKYILISHRIDITIVSTSAFVLRWHQWFLYPMTHGQCLLLNIWSFASTATSTPGGPMQSPVDTPSTKTTTSTSHTTKWWLPSGWSAYSLKQPISPCQAKLNLPLRKTMTDTCNLILFGTFAQFGGAITLTATVTRLVCLLWHTGV